MESSGSPHRILISESTATLLQQAGMGDCVTARPDKVRVKCKVSLQTYCVNSAAFSIPAPSVKSRAERLVDEPAKASTTSAAVSGALSKQYPTGLRDILEEMGQP